MAGSEAVAARSRRPGGSMSLGALLGALLLIGALTASPASAFEQVGIFAGSATPIKEGEEFAEEVQLGGVYGMAVNYTGAGGVPAGTIYAVTERAGEGGAPGNGPGVHIVRYNPDRSFSETWDFLSKKEEEAKEAKGELPYIRCGPEGDPTYPSCPPRPGEQRNSDIGIDVDQTTGNVYVFHDWNEQPGTPAITVYSADGAEVITRFAVTAPNGELIAQSPEKVHQAAADNIAVDAAGTVYVFDRTDSEENFYHRLMVWKPQSPGDYQHYVYAGQSNDIAAGGLKTSPYYPTEPTVDASGYVYVVGSEGVIQKYDPAHPADPPLCSFTFKKGGIASMTVNPLSGEVFFYAANNDRKLHRLSPCKEGKLSEVESLKPSPDLRPYGLAYDPVRAFGPGRPVGILYGGAGGYDLEGGGEAGNPSQSALGYVFAPANEIPPEVLSEGVSQVTQTSARLEGQVNPKGTPSLYSFQYISDAAYRANEPADRFAGAGEAPVGGGLLEGSKALPVGDAVGGLSPDTLYHYRLRAVSNCSPSEPEKECVALGAGRTFRTYPAGGLGLPDGRAYELVSPAEKNGGQVFPADPTVSSCPATECKPGAAFNQFPMQSAPDGDSIVYEGNPFSYEVGAVIENQYIARRNPETGWQSVNLTPAQLQSKANGGYWAFKADLSEGVLSQSNFPLTPAGPAGFGNLYRQRTDTPDSLDRLLTAAPPNRVPDSIAEGISLFFAGASADFTRLFFSVNDALTEETPFAPAAVDGGVSKSNLYEWSAGQLRLVNVAPGNATSAPGAVFGSGSLLSPIGTIPDVVTANSISADGRRAFWSSESGQVYVREDGETTRELTDHSGKFLTASLDGSKVLLSDGCLYDLEAEACEDLTQGKGGFEGIVGQSEDLSHVYFVDTAVLSEEQNGNGDEAQTGKHNLYAWAAGATPTFIATLGSADSDDWRLELSLRTAQASPGGDWLAFLSGAPLTGFDNTGPCTGISGTENFIPGPCREVFLYRASTGELRCVSCTPSGAAPSGPSTLRRILDGKQAPRYLTDAGRFFFDSQDSLSPADSNGRVEDVYEFEPNDIGSCKRAEGCVSLISAGRSGVDSNFLAADPSGKNVFFTSRDKLVGADKDELIDLYVAREGGGFPPETGSAECQGEACLPAASAPNRPALGSLAQRGAGNLNPARPRCPKGKIRKRGRCVKKHRGSRAHQDKRRRNRGGAK